MSMSDEHVFKCPQKPVKIVCLLLFLIILLNWKIWGVQVMSSSDRNDFLDHVAAVAELCDGYATAG